MRFSNRPLSLLPSLAFDPPSDFVDDSGGGGGSSKRNWKIFGCGCGTLILLFGIMIALGTAKMCSFVGGIKDGGIRTVAMQQFSQNYASALANEEPAQLYKKLSPVAKQGKSEAQFVKELQEHREFMKGAVMIQQGFAPTNQDLQSAQDIKNLDEWAYTGRFYPRKGAKALGFTLVVKMKNPTEELEFGQTAEGVVERLEFKYLPVSFNTEPPAMSVLNLHGTLQSGDMRRAYSRLGMQMRTQQSQVDFEKFIKSQGKLFTQSTMEIVDVRYPSAKEAQVTAMLKSSDGKSAVVNYELAESMGWRIYAIAPMVQGSSDQVKEEPTLEINKEGEEPKKEADPKAKAPEEAKEKP